MLYNTSTVLNCNYKKERRGKTMAKKKKEQKQQESEVI